MGALTIANSLNVSNPRPSYTEVRRVTMGSKVTLDSAGYASVIAASQFKSPGELLGTFSRTALLGTMRCRTLSVSPVPTAGLGIFDVTMVADTDYQWLTPKAGAGSRQYVLSVSTEVEANEREVELWRSNYTIQPAKNKNDTGLDIGGTSTTSGGKPMIQKIKVTDIRISMVIDTANGPSNLVPVYDTISLVKNKWNSAAFLNWSADQVFCTNASVTQMREEFYRVTYSFRRDAWYDCTQEPERDLSGFILYSPSTDDPQTVCWRSDYRLSHDLNVIFNDCFDANIAKDMAKKGSFLS